MRCLVVYRYDIFTRTFQKGKCILPKDHDGPCEYEVIKGKVNNG